MSLLVDPSGRPITSEPQPQELSGDCPRCGDGPEKRQVIEALGGHWRVLCLCGHEMARGRGLPPLVDDGFDMGDSE